MTHLSKLVDYFCKADQTQSSLLYIDIKQCSKTKAYLDEFFTEYKRLLDTFPRFLLSSRRHTLFTLFTSDTTHTPTTLARALVGVSCAPRINDVVIDQQWVTLKISGTVQMPWVASLLLHVVRAMGDQIALDVYSSIPDETTTALHIAHSRIAS